jgi:hypothetical protein
MSCKKRGKMSPSTLRVSGWILLLAAVLSIIGLLLGFVLPGPQGQNGPSSVPVTIVNLIAGIGFLLGLPSAYLAQRNQVGIVGLIGIIALWLTAFLFDIVLNILPLAIFSGPPTPASAGSPPPFIFALFIIGTLLELIGGILLGLRTIQGRVFPSLIGWILIVAVVLSAVSFPLEGAVSVIVSTISNALLFVGFGWFGYAIAMRAIGTFVQPAGTEKRVGS